MPEGDVPARHLPASATPAPELEATRCAICGTPGNTATVYESNFQAENLTPEVFSARRPPDRLHYRIVRCRTCGLLRSDPMLSAEAIEPLYQESRFTYGGETANLQYTYGAYLRGLERHGLEQRCVRKGALLEIGCGNGFFLEEAVRQGYGSVAGVEPSRGGGSRGVRIYPSLPDDRLLRTRFVWLRTVRRDLPVSSTRSLARARCRAARMQTAAQAGRVGAHDSAQRPGALGAGAGGAKPDHRHRAHLSLHTPKHSSAYLRSLESPSSIRVPRGTAIA